MVDAVPGFRGDGFDVFEKSGFLDTRVGDTNTAEVTIRPGI